MHLPRAEKSAGEEVLIVCWPYHYPTMRPSDQRCQYTILRYQPNEERGEFINIYLVVWDPQTKTLAWDWALNRPRALRFFGSFDERRDTERNFQNPEWRDNV